MVQKIIVKNIEKPVEKNVDQDVEWLCDSFGFSTGRDLQDITPKTVLTLVREYKEGAQSEDLAEEMKISPSRVNYHIRTLIDSGFLYRQRKLIHLRAGSMKAAVEELRKDANRIFDELSSVAEDIDSALGFKSRD